MFTRNTVLTVLMMINVVSAGILEEFSPVEQNVNSLNFNTIVGGRCRNNIDGGRYYKQIKVSEETVLDDGESEFLVRKGIQRCARACKQEGDMCKGFDYRMERAERYTNCYFNANTPVSIREKTRRNDYSSWLCYAKIEEDE